MFKRLTAIALAASLALPLQAQDADTVLATVNGTPITVGHVIIAAQSLPQQYQQLPDEVLFQGILDQLIRQEALAQSFEGELPARATYSIQNETRSLTAAEAIELMLAEKMTEEAIQAAYDEEYADQDPGLEYNASHILVETEDAAKALVTELEGGADFADLAKEKSTGPSGPNGGSLGWFGAGMMVAEFEQAVMAMEVGAVSAPVETQFGWHVIKLNETRAKNLPQLEEVRAQMEEKVGQQAMESHVEGLMENVDLDRSGAEAVEPAILRNLGLLE
jgi:peptidyl-prolyl cis-trans isomerase C